MATNDKIRTLISLSKTLDEADVVVNEYCEFPEKIEAKITFLNGLFENRVVFRKEDANVDDLEEDYYALLTTIIDYEDDLFDT